MNWESEEFFDLEPSVQCLQRVKTGKPRPEDIPCALAPAADVSHFGTWHLGSGTLPLMPSREQSTSPRPSLAKDREEFDRFLAARNKPAVA
jgi:hypothetical protein